MMHEGLWRQLVGLDRQETAQRAKCRYLSDSDCYVITLLNTEYVVDLSDKRISSVQSPASPVSAEFLEQLCILAYLVNAKDIPLAGKLVKPEVLPGGQFFFRGLHALGTDKLERVFGENPQRLRVLGEQFGGERCDFADASIRLFVLPRVPLTIVMWRGDEEFEARAAVLFDQSVSEQLPLDALWVAAKLTVDTLIKAADKP